MLSAKSAASCRTLNDSPHAGGKGPVVRGFVSIANGVRVTLDVPGDLAWFDGHFPSEPILPGVVQTGWAVTLARVHFGFDADPPDLDRIKFLRPVRPGARLELELVRDERQPGRITWHLSEDGVSVSSGRMDFVPG